MKTDIKNENSESDEMLDEYDFDYSKSKPNKFAKDFHKSTIRVYDGPKLIKEMKPVFIEVDIVKHFKTSMKINSALRSLMQ